MSIWRRPERVRAVAAAAATLPPPPDTTPPTVGITSPSSGDTVTGAVTVLVSAADDRGVERVDLYVNGTYHASSTSSFSWDATELPAPEEPEPPQPDPADTVAPAVSITSVLKTGNTIKVTVSAADDVGVTLVELYVDGVVVGKSTSSAPEFKLYLKSYSSGWHTVQARAYDAAGNSAWSQSKTFKR